MKSQISNLKTQNQILKLKISKSIYPFNPQPITHNLKLDSGQTIIEVVVSLTLIILFLSGVVIVELFAIRNVDFAQKKSIAARLARQQLERARVVRDSSGIEVLRTNCHEPSSCYIDYIGGRLVVRSSSPAPTGIYAQSLTIESSSECPLPTITVTPPPEFYKATSIVSWPQNVTVTPVQQVRLSTCITDWR